MLERGDRSRALRQWERKRKVGESSLDGGSPEMNED